MTNSEASSDASTSWKNEPPYATREDFRALYTARCLCGRIEYEVDAPPVDAKLCHCRGCQVAHGAPMQWAAIFHKHNVQFTRGIDLLEFYSDELDVKERSLPCKVKCSHCHTMIADEGRRMWLAFPSLFGFPTGKTPKEFQPTCHIFYGARSFDMDDGLPKFIGHKQR